MADVSQRPLRSWSQPAGNLLWRPVLVQALDGKGARLKQVEALAVRQMAPFGADRMTGAALVGVAPQYPPDGGAMTAKGAGDSLGNMVSRRNSAHGLSTASANAWGMAYGALILLALIFATSTPLVAPADTVYLMALLYLAIFGSIVGFTTYLLLVARVGSSRAAYATVLFPIVAIALSALFESYHITAATIAGILLAITGNIVMFSGNDSALFAWGRKSE